MRLSSTQPGQLVGELRVATTRPAELRPGPRVDLFVDRVIGLPLDYRALGQAQRGRARTPPPAQWLPALGGTDVVTAGALLGGGLALVLPRVAEVIALGDGDDYGQRLPPLTSSFGRGTNHDHSDNAMVCAAMDHGDKEDAQDQEARE